MFITLIVVMVLWVYAYVQTHQMYTFYAIFCTSTYTSIRLNKYYNLARSGKVINSIKSESQKRITN